MNITTNTDPNPLAELAAAVRLGRKLASTASADLEAATPVLIDAIRHQSGQSAKIERILWSVWNDSHQINLCDSLSGLDSNIAQATIAMIAARAYLGGDADDQLRVIIDGAGSQLPEN